MWEIKDNKSTYILRYYLPVEPYCDRDTTVKRLNELIEFCKKTNTEAVMLYCGFMPNWYYMPDTLEHSLECANEMKEYAEVIKSAGISYQLNFQMTLGAHDGDVNMNDKYSWEKLVDHRGTERACACPIGEKFRDIMGKQLKAWAATEPDVLWIDDDLRYHNHSTTFEEYYCYCENHLKGFEKYCGKYYTREALLEEAFKEGKPTDTRIKWLDYLNETMFDTAEWIGKTVHSVSPYTRVAQMTSNPDSHAVEGRNWDSFLTGLSDGAKAITRPHFGPYNESAPSAFVGSYSMLEKSMTNTNSQYKKGVDYCPEIENTRFTVWSKSAAATTFQLKLSLLQGCPGITLSLFDLEGTRLEEEPAYFKMLKDSKPYLDSLARLNLSESKKCGICFITDSKLGKKVQNESGELHPSGMLKRGHTWDGALLQMGVAAYYIEPEAITKKSVYVLDGISAYLPSDDEMLKILSAGVLLDSLATKVLIERGFGKYIGIKKAKIKDTMTSAEIFNGNIIKEIPEKRMPLRLATGKWCAFELGNKSEAISEIITPDGIKHPGTVAFQNELGGRVVSYAGCSALPNSFFNHQRVRWINAIINWLSKDTEHITVKATQKMLTLQRDRNKEKILAFSNLSTDNIELIECCGFEDKKFEVNMLMDNGEWESINSDRAYYKDGHILIKCALKTFDWLVVRIK